MQHILKQSLLVVLALFTISGTGYVFAQPTSAPGGSSAVPLPLHTGTESQTKQGNLTVNGTLTASTISSSTICLNGSCQNAWPTGGGIESVSVNSAGYWNTYCYASNYENYGEGYYWYGTYTTNGTQWCTGNQVVTVAMNVPGLAGRQVISSDNLTIWCRGGTYDYQYSGFPATSYANDSSYPFRTQGSIVSYTVNGDTLNLTASCRMGWGAGYYYVYGIVSAQGSLIVAG